VTWLLVAVGGALGSTVGALLMRRPTGTRIMVAVATVCFLSGAVSTQLLSVRLSALLSYGVLSSAASMVVAGLASPIWIGGDAPVRSTVAVAKRLAVYCVVGVTFALLGYLAVLGGTTLYKKLT
jgi:hypothetical protein